MTNLILLSIQLVTNDVSFTKPGSSFLNTNQYGLCCIEIINPLVLFQKKEVWQLYTIGYLPYKGPQLDINSGLYFSSNEIPVKMLTLSNMIGTLEPKQETNWVFMPSNIK